MMMTGVMIAGSASAAMHIASRRVGRFWLRGRLRRRARSTIATIMAPPMSRPGTMPPRNSAPTETSARLP